MDIAVLDALNDRALELNAVDSADFLGPTYTPVDKPSTEIKILAKAMLEEIDNVSVDIAQQDLIDFPPMVDSLTVTPQQTLSDEDAFQEDLQTNLPMLVEPPAIANHFSVNVEGSTVALANDDTEILTDVRDLLDSMNSREDRRERASKFVDEEFGALNEELLAKLGALGDSISNSSEDGGSGGGILDWLFGGAAAAGGAGLFSKFRKAKTAGVDPTDVKPSRFSSIKNFFTGDNKLGKVKDALKGSGSLRSKLARLVVGGGATMLGYEALTDSQDGDDSGDKQLFPMQDLILGGLMGFEKKSGDTSTNPSITNNVSQNTHLENVPPQANTDDDSWLPSMEVLGATGAVSAISAYELKKDWAAANKAKLPALPAPATAAPAGIPFKDGSRLAKTTQVLGKAGGTVLKGASRTVGRALPLANVAMAGYDTYDILTNDDLSDREKTVELSGVGGGMAGAAAGGAAGAAIGSVIPVAGTLIGGLIGAGLGYFGGSELTKSATDWFLDDEEETTVKAGDLKQQEQPEPIVTAGDVKAATMLSNDIVDSNTASTNQSPSNFEQMLQRDITDSIIRQPEIKPRPQQEYGFKPEPESIKGAESFVPGLMPYAEKAAQELGVDPKVLVAQAALETGWGKSVLKDGDESSRNLFNIKAGSRWEGDTVGLNALEYDKSGNAYREQSQFRAYDSYEQSFDDYVNFIKTNPRYKEALANSSDSEAYLSELQKAGYATDPEYADKIMRVMNNKNFASYAETSVAPEHSPDLAAPSFNVDKQLASVSPIPSPSVSSQPKQTNPSSVTAPQIAAAVNSSTPSLASSDRSPAEISRAFEDVTELYTNDVYGYNNWVNDYGNVTDFATYQKVYSDVEAGGGSAFNGALYGLKNANSVEPSQNTPNATGDSLVTADAERTTGNRRPEIQEHGGTSISAVSPESKELHSARPDNYIESQQLVSQKHTDEIVGVASQTAKNTAIAAQPKKEKRPEPKGKMIGTAKRGIDDAPIILADSGFTMLNVGYL